MNAPFYPIFLNLQGRNCLVVGGGKVAIRKIETLLESGANVQVVAPDICSEISSLAQQNKHLHLSETPYTEADITGRFLVICATNNEAVNRQVYHDADNRNIIVNVVDVPELCSFYVPSRFSRGDLSLAISTHGSSPAMARKIRKELETHFGEEYELMLALLKEMRIKLMTLCDNTDKRGNILKKLVNETELLEIVRTKGEDEARNFATDFIKNEL